MTEVVGGAMQGEMQDLHGSKKIPDAIPASFPAEI
jgi:hypothetical protein